MATLGQVGELVKTQLGERVDRLVSAVEDSTSDFTEITRRADAVAELADAVAELYSDVEQTLLRALDDGTRSEPERRPRRPQRSSEPAGPTDDDATKEELLEQAREVHISGRSSMTKEELARAVEAEQSVTKDELLERAREAEIEGRSSMSKQELRDALGEVST